MFGLFDPFWFVKKIITDEIKQSSKYGEGILLDVGCGTKPYKNLFSVKKYIGSDNSTLHKESVDIVSKGESLPFRDYSADTVLLTQVLEHICEPSNFLDEINRVLKVGGHLILTIPHISRIHGEPNDYYRFTKYGIEHLLKKSGFEIVYIKGIFDFWIMWSYLLNFFIYEKDLEYRKCNSVKRFISKLFPLFYMLINCFSLIVKNIDNNGKHTFDYIAVAKKLTRN